MPRGYTVSYTDHDLRVAIRDGRSWRSVMKRLGFVTTSGYTAEKLRREADRLGIDYSHFPLRRSSWTNEGVARAVASASTWAEAVQLLDSPVDHRTIQQVRGHAQRIGLDSAHLGTKWNTACEMPFVAQPNTDHLPKAAPLVAAAWFALRNYPVSFPVEPQPYDLIVEAEGSLWRIQVKSTNGRDPVTGSFVCRIGRIPRRDHRSVPYTSEEVDYFFIIDGDGTQYIAPQKEVAGQTSVVLSKLAHRRVGP